MTRNRLCHLCLLVGLATALSSCTSRQAIVEHFEVSIGLTAEGVADITETMTIRPGGEPSASFERLVAPSRAERLEFVSATIDGAPVPAGGLIVDPDTARVLRVIWRLDQATGARRLGLRYRASGVFSVSGRRGRFEWAAIPERRHDPIAEARIDVSVPEGVTRLGDWGIAEAGWQVASLSNGVAAIRAALPPGEGATVIAEVAVDPVAMVEPRWQHDEALGRQLVPAFISGGLFILTVGVGVIWIIWFERSSRSREPGGNAGQSQREGRRTAEGLYTAGLVCLAFGVIVTVGTHVTLGRYGAWSMAIPASILIVGTLFVVVGRRPDGQLRTGN